MYGCGSQSGIRKSRSGESDRHSVHSLLSHGEGKESKRGREKAVWLTGSSSDTGAAEGSPYYFNSCSPYAIKQVFYGVG